MRKFIYVICAFIIGLSINSCKYTNEIVVENTISTDRNIMSTKVSKDYIWYETDVILKDWMDEKNNNDIKEVINIFQVLEPIDSTTTDVHIYKFYHTSKGIQEQIIHDFMVGDEPLNNQKIIVTFKEAYKRMMAANYPKPHSRQVVLRKEVGAKECNVQWIFGNEDAQLYVDAVTGEVTDTNPAY